MSIKTTPEEYTALRARMAQLVQDATPEQKQKITDTVQEAANVMESFSRAFDSILRRNRGALAKKLTLRVDIPPNATALLNAYIQHGQAAGAVMDALEGMRQHPDIMASPFIAAFVTRLCDEVGQS